MSYLVYIVVYLIDNSHAIVNQFTESIRRDDGLSIYGEKHIFYCLGHKLLQYLIVSNDYYEINKNKLDAICEKGGCEIVITTSHIIKTYGDIVGLSCVIIVLSLESIDHFDNKLVISVTKYSFLCFCIFVSVIFLHIFSVNWETDLKMKANWKSVMVIVDDWTSETMIGSEV